MVAISSSAFSVSILKTGLMSCVIRLSSSRSAVLMRHAWSYVLVWCSSATGTEFRLSPSHTSFGYMILSAFLSVRRPEKDSQASMFSNVDATSLISYSKYVRRLAASGKILLAKPRSAQLFDHCEFARDELRQDHVPSSSAVNGRMNCASIESFLRSLDRLSDSESNAIRLTAEAGSVVHVSTSMIPMRGAAWSHRFC